MPQAECGPKIRARDASLNARWRAKSVVNLQQRTMVAITLEQLKDVVVHLSDKEFEELVEAREQAWDRQIEADAEAGKLDQLAEEALHDYREGKCIRLP
jgi:hypothetical protein